MPPAAKAAESLWRLDPVAYFAIGGFFLFFGLFFIAFLGQVEFLAWICIPPTVIPGGIAIAYGVVA